MAVAIDVTTEDGSTCSIPVAVYLLWEELALKLLLQEARRGFLGEAVFAEDTVVVALGVVVGVDWIDV